MNSQVKKLTFTALMAAMITILQHIYATFRLDRMADIFILAIALSISQRASFHGRMQ